MGSSRLSRARPTTPATRCKAGTVTLADNDAGSAAYNIQNARPGDTDEACIRVSYTGSLDADVKLYTTATSVADLGPHMNLVITPGSQVTPNLDCTGFVADLSGAISRPGRQPHDARRTVRLRRR